MPLLKKDPESHDEDLSLNDLRLFFIIKRGRDIYSGDNHQLFGTDGLPAIIAVVFASCFSQDRAAMEVLVRVRDAEADTWRVPSSLPAPPHSVVRKGSQAPHDRRS